MKPSDFIDVPLTGLRFVIVFLVAVVRSRWFTLGSVFMNVFLFALLLFAANYLADLKNMKVSEYLIEAGKCAQPTPK